MYELFAIGAGSALSTLLLTAEHFLLWGQKDQMSLTGRYMIGTLALAFGECAALLLLDRWGVLSRTSGLGAILGPICVGGAIILSLHYWRRQRGQSPWPQTLFEAGRVAGIAEERSNGTARER